MRFAGREALIDYLDLDCMGILRAIGKGSPFVSFITMLTQASHEALRLQNMRTRSTPLRM